LDSSAISEEEKQEAKEQNGQENMRPNYFLLSIGNTF
jgi:hypothetical protein